MAGMLEMTGADRLLDVQESAGLDGSLLARADSPGGESACSSPGYNCVNEGPAERADPAWTDPGRLRPELLMRLRETSVGLRDEFPRGEGAGRFDEVVGLAG